MSETNNPIVITEMKDQIKRIISIVKEDPTLVDTITDESDLVEDVGLTSLNLMRLMLEIEEEFDTEIDLRKIKNIDVFRTLENICEFVKGMK